jgi:hypothetical protein
MKKIILSVALVAMLAMAGVAYGAFAALEEQGTLSTSVLPAVGVTNLGGALQRGNVVPTTGDEAGEARYRENDLDNAADTTNRRELRVRGDALTVSSLAGFCVTPPGTCTITAASRADAADGDLYTVFIKGAGFTGTVRNAANTADATVPAEAGRIELRGRSEQDRPDPDITVPNLDTDPNGHLVQIVDKNGLVAQSGVIPEG